MTDLRIWTIIILLGAGTYLLRWSFLGTVGSRPLPNWVARLLRYTAVGVLPALVAPLAVWPAATDGQTDPARLAAAGATLLIGFVTKSTLAAIVAGGLALLSMPYLLG